MMKHIIGALAIVFFLACCGDRTLSFFTPENPELELLIPQGFPALNDAVSTVNGENNKPDTYKQGVDAYRDIVLTLPSLAKVSKSGARIVIKADFDKLLSGKANTITLGEGNAVPNTHTAVNMKAFVDNLGGDGTSDITGMFSIDAVKN